MPERDCLGLREKIKKFQGLRDISVTKVIALQEEGPEFDSQFCFVFKLNMVMPACNLNTGEVESSRSGASWPV